MRRGGLTAAGRKKFKRTEGANLKPGLQKLESEMTPSEMRRKAENRPGGLSLQLSLLEFYRRTRRPFRREPADAHDCKQLAPAERVREGSGAAIGSGISERVVKRCWISSLEGRPPGGPCFGILGRDGARPSTRA